MIRALVPAALALLFLATVAAAPYIVGYSIDRHQKPLHDAGGDE